MSHIGHRIEKCKHGKVFMQCRCMSPDKTVIVVPCEKIFQRSPFYSCDELERQASVTYDVLLNEWGEQRSWWWELSEEEKQKYRDIVAVNTQGGRDQALVGERETRRA